MSETNPKIQDLVKIEHDTIMPLINMNFYNVSFDLVFAKVQNIDTFEDIIKNDLYNNDYIKNMEESMRKSMNGFRNNEMILRSVENKKNTPEQNQQRIEVFRLTLRVIKHWSKKQGLNSNKMGY